MMYKAKDVINERYEIVRRIGHGSTAIVYKAKDLKDGKEVALKVSKADATVSNNNKRFEQEAELLVKFNNKNIVKAFEVLKRENETIIVMEFLKGKELNDYLEQKGKIEPQESVNFILQIINALKDLHSEGIMHRDLKPQNLFLVPGNIIKLMDFGIAQVSEDQNLTRVGSVIGTVGYMSPELLTQRTKANVKTEIYALGVVLYKMLTGTLPYSGNGDQALARAIVDGGALSVKEVNQKIDSNLSKVVEKMMAHNYINRFDTLEEVEEVLNNYSAGTLKMEETIKKKKGLFRRRKAA